LAGHRRRHRGRARSLDEAIEKLKAEHSELRQQHITRARACLRVDLAFFYSMSVAFGGMILGGGNLMRSGPKSALRPTIIEASAPRLMDQTLRCPAGLEGRRREAGEAARRGVEAR